VLFLQQAMHMRFMLPRPGCRPEGLSVWLALFFIFMATGIAWTKTGFIAGADFPHLAFFEPDRRTSITCGSNGGVSPHCFPLAAWAWRR
jgi:hypothetical protein